MGLYPRLTQADNSYYGPNTNIPLNTISPLRLGSNNKSADFYNYTLPLILNWPIPITWYDLTPYIVPY